MKERRYVLIYDDSKDGRWIRSDEGRDPHQFRDPSLVKEVIK
jgi:hypothetical protein